MSSVGTLLRRIIGIVPEQKEVEEQLKERQRKFDENNDKLDTILGEIEEMNVAARMKKAGHDQTVVSIRAASSYPPADESEVTTKYSIPARG